MAITDSKLYYFLGCLTYPNNSGPVTTRDPRPHQAPEDSWTKDGEDLASVVKIVSLSKLSAAESVKELRLLRQC